MQQDIYGLLRGLDLVKQSGKATTAPRWIGWSPCGCRRETSDGGCRDYATSDSWAFQKRITLPSGERVQLRKGLWAHRECGAIIDVEARRILNVCDLTALDYTEVKPGTTGQLPPIETLEELLENATGLNPADSNHATPALATAGGASGLHYPGGSTTPEWMGAD